MLMRRNPAIKLIREAQRIAQRAATTAADLGRTTVNEQGGGIAGEVDATTGVFTRYGMLDLDDFSGGGFRLS